MKYFAANTVEAMRSDVKWLSRATDAIMEHWRMKSARRSVSLRGESVSLQKPPTHWMKLKDIDSFSGAS